MEFRWWELGPRRYASLERDGDARGTSGVDLHR
jgi:hypothetical protein